MRRLFDASESDDLDRWERAIRRYEDAQADRDAYAAEDDDERGDAWEYEDEAEDADDEDTERVA
jgi:hypothetical protein